MDYVTEYIDRRTKWEVLHMRPVREVVFHTCRKCLGDQPIPEVSRQDARDELLPESWRGKTCSACGGPVCQTWDRRSWLHVLRSDWVENPHNVEPVPQ